MLPNDAIKYVFFFRSDSLYILVCEDYVEKSRHANFFGWDASMYACMWLLAKISFVQHQPNTLFGHEPAPCVNLITFRLIHMQRFAPSRETRVFESRGFQQMVINHNNSSNIWIYLFHVLISTQNLKKSCKIYQ